MWNDIMTTVLTFAAEVALCYGVLCGLTALVELAIRRLSSAIREARDARSAGVLSFDNNPLSGPVYGADQCDPVLSFKFKSRPRLRLLLKRLLTLVAPTGDEFERPQLPLDSVCREARTTAVDKERRPRATKH
jgi:hypothetical protein